MIAERRVVRTRVEQVVERLRWPGIELAHRSSPPAMVAQISEP
jgi:hypothetical protein